MKYFNIACITQALMVLLFVSGCKKDLGNYTYTDINKVGITNIEKSYTANYLVDTLKINPELSFSLEQGDPGGYEYEWIGVSTDVNSTARRTLLGSSRNLKYLVQLKPGGYDIYFRVKDKKTEVTAQLSFKLVVVTSTYEGWLVLTDIDQRSVLSMVSLNGNSSRIVPDLLSNSGMPEQKSPLKIVFSSMMSAPPDNVALLSRSGAQRVNPEFFSWSPELNVRYEMLEQTTPDFAAQLIHPVDVFSEFLISMNGDVYFKDPTDGNSFSAPRNRIEGQSNSGFKAAPFVAHGTNTYNVDAVFYDLNNKRFVRLGYKAAACTLIPDGTLFSYQTGRDLVFMSNSAFNNGDTFAILKDAQQKFYLYRFNVGAKISQNYYDVMSAEGIANASLFAVHPSLGYVFYAVGSKVYEYDMNSRTAKLMLDFGGKEVTLLKFNTFTSFGKYYKPVYKDLERQLLVGTADMALAKNEVGSLMLYEVPSVNQALILKKEYHGLGKIKDVVYRERNQ
jgi:hypothetical protein